MIASFQDEYRFLSNFTLAEVTFEGVLYASTEHAYQAAKVLDPVLRETVRQAPTSGAAKRMGNEFKKRGKIRSDWLEVRVGIMEGLLRQKFTNHPELRALLLATGNQELIEGNTWKDDFWGVYKGKGQNMLGKLLMQIRFELQTQR